MKPVNAGTLDPANAPQQQAAEGDREETLADILSTVSHREDSYITERSQDIKKLLESVVNSLGTTGTPSATSSGDIKTATKHWHNHALGHVFRKGGAPVKCWPEAGPMGDGPNIGWETYLKYIAPKSRKGASYSSDVYVRLRVLAVIVWYLPKNKQRRIELTYAMEYWKVDSSGESKDDPHSANRNFSLACQCAALDVGFLDLVRLPGNTTETPKEAEVVQIVFEGGKNSAQKRTRSVGQVDVLNPKGQYRCKYYIDHCGMIWDPSIVPATPSMDADEYTILTAHSRGTSTPPSGGVARSEVSSNAIAPPSALVSSNLVLPATEMTLPLRMVTSEELLFRDFYR